MNAMQRLIILLLGLSAGFNLGIGLMLQGYPDIPRMFSPWISLIIAAMSLMIGIMLIASGNDREMR